jgi:hypothetical protein
MGKNYTFLHLRVRFLEVQRGSVRRDSPRVSSFAPQHALARRRTRLVTGALR